MTGLLYNKHHNTIASPRRETMAAAVIWAASKLTETEIDMKVKEPRLAKIGRDEKTEKWGESKYTERIGRKEVLAWYVMRNLLVIFFS